MADWVGLLRTNYFKVRDQDEFLKWYESTTGGAELIRKNDRFGFYVECGDWPSLRLVENDDGDPEEVEIDFIDELAKHLPDDEVLVVTAAGHVKARFATGYALAIRNTGETKYVSIDDIYRVVQDSWGITPTRAEY